MVGAADVPFDLGAVVKGDREGELVGGRVNGLKEGVDKARA